MGANEVGEASAPTGDQFPVAAAAPGTSTLTPVVKWLALAEFIVGIGALVALGETNPLYYLLIIAVALSVIALVAFDQRRRDRVERQAQHRREALAALAEAAAGPAVAPTSSTLSAAAPTEAFSVTTSDGTTSDGTASHDAAVADASAARRVGAAAEPLRSDREVFVASLVEYGLRTGVRTVRRDDAPAWAEAQHIEYSLLRAASCCAENEREIVGELTMWDSVSVVHLLETPMGVGQGVARSVVAPYGRLPAATRVNARRDPTRLSCEVATLALDPAVANEHALNLLWRGIYDHARRGGATHVVWTLASELAALWRDHFGFPIEVLGEGKRLSASTATVTIMVSLPELEVRMMRDRPAYYGWLTVGFTDAERAALALPIDLSGAYDRVCDFVLAQLEASKETLALR